MTTIEAHIARHAALHPDKLAIVCGTDRCSYAALNARIDARAAVLSAVHVPYAALSAQPPISSPPPASAPPPASTPSPASIVPLRAEPSIDFLVTYFALHRLGLVAAPLERDMPEETFQRISAELTAHHCPTGIADVLYTTGTTGRSKGVMVSHKAIMADAENLIAGQGFSPDLHFVVSGPLNHIGSLSKVYPVMLLGATLIIVDGLKNLDSFFNAFTINDEPCATNHAQTPRYATFLVPASIRILLQLAPDRIAALADRMDFIETGAAAMAQADMESLCHLLPNTRLYNTYASTETGIICTHNFNPTSHPSPLTTHLSPLTPHHSPLTSHLSPLTTHLSPLTPHPSPPTPHPCNPRCLGCPMPHSGVFITANGLIACTGDTLMTGYVGEPERTAQVLRDGVLYTADLGSIDEQGRLHLRGREDDVINVGGYKVAPTEVEDVAMGHPSVADCICIAKDHKITGKALKLLVVTAPNASLDKRSLARYLRDRLEAYKVPMLYEQVDSIRRTFNGKPDRKFYL